MRTEHECRLFAHGFSYRKLGFLKRFLGKSVKTVKTGKGLLAGDKLYLWGSGAVPGGTPHGVKVIRVEDGFLRSVGLGAGLAAPLSWVMDAEGIYYDPSRPSELENILNKMEFDDAQLVRAAKIRKQIVAHGLSKYNVGVKDAWRSQSLNRTILVPGQVEDDASIRMGAIGVSTNIGLLRAVRQANPDAHIVYKPHPDVVHGLRSAADGQAEQWADEVISSANIVDMLRQVDEVHVMTSLTGFEALLRGKKVVCYGQPFYAGWGMTTDMIPHLRRTRTLTLNELVAGVLVSYPHYLHPITKRPAAVEAVVDGLAAMAEKGPTLMDAIKMKIMQTVGSR